MPYAPLTTVEQLKSWLSISGTQSASDAQLASLVESISDLIGRELGRDNLGSVETYTELYPARLGYTAQQQRLLLDHYPVVSLTQVTHEDYSYNVITDPRQLHKTSGVFLENDRRTIQLRGGSPVYGVDIPIVITYTAGYAQQDVPPGLAQAANQAIGEVFKSRDWIGYQSKTLAGETVTFELGGTWGLSKRTRAMLQPFTNRIPSSSLGG